MKWKIIKEFKMKKNCCICREVFKLPENPEKSYENHACRKCIKVFVNTNHPLFRENKNAS